MLSTSLLFILVILSSLHFLVLLRVVDLLQGHEMSPPHVDVVVEEEENSGECGSH
jgi:hypothetical protein